jgi:membrane-associated protein
VILLLLLIAAAVIGDSVNYWIGARIGERAFSGRVRFLKTEHLDRTRAFYARHGGKTIVLARFIPIIRTFAPFVAGVGRMHYPRFLAYNVAGAVLWVSLFVLGGYFFGNIRAVRSNFTIVILDIIALTLGQVFVELLRGRRSKVA